MPLDLIVIGASLGGLTAIRRLVSSLPGDFPIPIAMVQHRGVYQDDSLRGVLQVSTSLCVVEVEDKLPIEAGHLYVAPQDYHLLVDAGCFSLSIEDKVQRARPSIDVLFESAAFSYGQRLAGVVLTGASRDGAGGTRAILAHGGKVFAEDPQIAEAGLMPQAAIEAGAEPVAAIEEIAKRLVTMAEEPAPRRRHSEDWTQRERG